jgi:hypothetical protein
MPSASSNICDSSSRASSSTAHTFSSVRSSSAPAAAAHRRAAAARSSGRGVRGSLRAARCGAHARSAAAGAQPAALAGVRAAGAGAAAARSAAQWRALRTRDAALRVQHAALSSTLVAGCIVCAAVRCRAQRRVDRRRSAVSAESLSALNLRSGAHLATPSCTRTCCSSCSTRGQRDGRAERAAARCARCVAHVARRALQQRSAAGGVFALLATQRGGDARCRATARPIACSRGVWAACLAPLSGLGLPLGNMNPADLDNLAQGDKDELLGIIETMQTRDRCGAAWAVACAAWAVCHALRGRAVRYGAAEDAARGAHARAAPAASACACTTAWWSAAS